MSIKKTLGGDRLGAGKQMKIEMHNFERSNHDIGYMWRSTMATGTLVPFMSEIGLSGDTFDISLNADVRTYPTVGPLFGSFKLQLDVFVCPMRLYQGQLHNNKLGVGNQMNKVKLPQLKLETQDVNYNSHIPVDIQQINPSSIMSYLGLNGIGTGGGSAITKYKNALSYIAYWDIVKNYYINKQEEKAAYINAIEQVEPNIQHLRIKNSVGVVIWGHPQPTDEPIELQKGYTLEMEVHGGELNLDKTLAVANDGGYVPINKLYKNITVQKVIETYIYIASELADNYVGMEFVGIHYDFDNMEMDVKPNVEFFEIENLDKMREDIISKVKETDAFIIDKDTYAPYGTTIGLDTVGYNKLRYPLQGLALKTYQSDVFNSWMKTEWIDGENGINAITAVDVSDGELKIDALILARKVYDMLNRIAMSGGSYYDWIEAVYGENPFRSAESPVYHGGLSKEIVFEEVISNAETDVDGTSPLGTLAGKGRLSDKHKGGKLKIKIQEPSYIIGIVSITPRVDYSQGNRWDTRLQTMDDLHKPSLDGIGFQDLITEQMAWWDTKGENNENERLQSAGKQPAWINYMTNYNRCHGHFADANKEMFMTLNRRYSVDKETHQIKDLTTYIDPSKFNYAFAQADISAQNFWVQIDNNIEARRKISAKQIPNL